MLGIFKYFRSHNEKFYKSCKLSQSGKYEQFVTNLRKFIEKFIKSYKNYII